MARRNNLTHGTGSRSFLQNPGVSMIDPLPWVDVRDHGAAGDDISDDTAALDAAYANAAANALPVYLPAGTYLTSGNTLPAGFVALFGDGNDVSILKRIGAASASNAIIGASTASDFSIADIGVDGNKANQSLGGNNIQLTAVSDIVLRGVRSFGAKAAGGYGTGILLNLVPDSNPTGREVGLLNVECYDNDSDGLSIARTGAAISVDGGVFSDNGASGIYFYDQAITPAAATVPNMRIVGVRAERNTSAGIALLGFFVSGLSSTRTYGHGSDPVEGLVVANCQVNSNGGYGIFAQVTGASITGNVCRANGTASEAGICANAQDTSIIGNIIEGGGIASGAYFGIDAGGLKWGTVAHNKVANVRGTGINLGAAEGVVCNGNVTRECGFAHINVALNDAGSKWFPWDAKDITIRDNLVVNTTSTSIFGILVTGRPEHVNILENRAEWPDTLGNNFIRPGIESGIVRGNLIVNQGYTSAGYGMNAAASIVIPDWVDALNLNLDAAIITSILTSTQGTYIGGISAVKMTNRGSGYTADFAVTLTAPDGTGFLGTARVTQDGRVACVTIEAQGTSYLTTTYAVDFSAGSGSGAAATAYMGLHTPWGRELTLVAFAANFRLQTGTLLTTPAPTGAAITVNAGGALLLRGVSGGWVTLAVSDGAGIAAIQQLALNNGRKVLSGTGTPEGVVTAPVGSLFLREDGGATTTLYVKTSGTGNTGWTAK
jgi:hypothetical protein